MPFLRKQISWIVLIVGTAASLSAYLFFVRLEHAAVRAEFVRRCQVIAHVIENSLRSHETTLYSLRNLFHYSEQVTREEFAGAADDLLKLNDGIQALEWIPRVPGTQRANLEAAVRAEGYPHFQFTERDGPDRLVRAADRPEHYPVLYIHPYEGNAAALGFDLASGVTWPSLQRAARENILVASGRLPLITDGRSRDWGYLLELPVYATPNPPDAAARLRSLRGFVLGIFRLEKIIEGSLGQLQAQGVDILVLDGQSATSDRFLHYHSSRMRADHASQAVPPTAEEFTAAPYHHTIVLQLPQRTWEVHCRAAPEWLATRRDGQPFFALLSGLLITALLGIYLRGTLRRADLVEREVATRTNELRQTQALLQEDIRRRQQTEQALHASEARLQAIVDYSPALIFVKDLEGRYLLANSAYCDLLLPPSTRPIGRTDFDLFPAEYAALFRQKDQQVITRGEPAQFEEPVLTNRGEVRTCLTQKFLLRDSRGQPYALCGIATDITTAKTSEKERLALQQQLLEAKKLEALGVLAGGIAHDFNNILTSILGNASLTRAQLDPASPAHPQLEQIEQAARRAADLCAQMLAYAGKGAFVTGPVDIGQLVRDTAALLKVSLHKGTRLDLDLAAALPAVIADSTQLRQIVMNLVLNAADAIGARPDGVITLATRALDADASLFRQAVQRPERPAGRYVMLEVRDNGSGMTPETLARIFEPFFTTKFSGRGLGLAAVLGIVNSHRGALFVESTPGQGTTFRLLLPAVDTPVAAPSPAAPKTDRGPLRGTILLVDDEPDVRLVSERVLSRNHLTPLLAASGEEALALCREHGAAINVILLDLTMPGLSGQETLVQLQALKLPAKVIIMSGYSEAETMARCASLGAVGFLHKPFEIDQLLGAIRKFLT